MVPGKEMKRLLTICMVLVLVAAAASAQTRIPCDRTYRDNPERALTRADAAKKWEGKVVIPVLLMAYPDVGFSVSDEDIVAYWNDILNKPGYNENGAHGSVADYFKKQSSGLFEPVFEIIGPVTVPEKRAYYGENRNGKQGEDVKNYELIRDACVAAGIDWKVYDSDDDGEIDVVLTVFAGPGENRGGPADAIWPHKSVNNLKVGDVYVGPYTCVSELDNTGKLDGYGTFVHEFSHCLQLPDLYPVSGSAYSIFDEWDLMDGGNYAFHGFGIPNYSAFERWICGWYEFQELTDPTTITDMPVWDEEPVAYLIRNDDKPEEYYILENRRQQGFDYYIPGNGLLVTHVKRYSIGDLFPNNSSYTKVGLVPADNRDYHQSEAYFHRDDGKKTSPRSNYLSLAAYPYVVGDSANNHLTDTSIPAMTFHKPVTNITMDANGRISFDFMKEETAIRGVRSVGVKSEEWYDLRGRRLPAAPSTPGIYIIRDSSGKTKKIIQ